jgi:protein arginine kinase activator
MFADGTGWELETGGSPLCESCGAEPAVVHLVQVQDGAIAHTHLCQRCAQQAAEEGPASMAVVFAMPAMLTGLFGNALASEKGRRAVPPSLDDPVCGVCATTLEQVTDSGQLGCAACYGVFAAQVEQAIAAAHDSLAYHGKLPRNLPVELDGRREVVRLRRMMTELVENERFEEAASVRDRLAELDAGPAGDRAAAPGGLPSLDTLAPGE